MVLYRQTLCLQQNDFQCGAKRGGTEEYGGALRAMLLASLARGRGYKMSPKFGLVDPK